MWSLMRTEVGVRALWMWMRSKDGRRRQTERFSRWEGLLMILSWAVTYYGDG